MAGSGGQSENSSNLERRLHPSFPDPAKSYKISDCRKPLCQSPQEQLPVGGITSAYRQECNRTGPQSNISRVFQPAFSGTQTQQQVEAYTGPKQTKSFPQGGEIQNGDTGNHQDIPPVGGVGNLSRLQGCLLPYTNTGTVQEISQISCPGSDLPIQSTAIWSVHSAHGVHCLGKGGETDGHTQGYKNPPVPRRLVGQSQIPPNLSPAHPNPGQDVPRSRLAGELRKIRTGAHCLGKGGETDGHTQGYKNPPVPRRLVGQSQIPPNLSPAHPNPGQDVPRSRLAGELRKIRTGAQTSLQLCMLPVRPQVRPGQTDTGPVAKSSRKNTKIAVTTGLSGPTVHVLLTATEKQVHLSRLHMRPIQWHLKTIGGYRNL